MKRSLFMIAAFFLVAGSAQAADDKRESVRVRVQGDVFVAPGDVVETAVAVLGSVSIDGNVAENAVSVFGDVNISSRGSVGGDAISVGGRVLREPGSHVGGREIAVQGPGKDLGRVLLLTVPLLAAAVALVGALVVLASTVGFIVLIVAILVLFERNVAAARQAMVSDPFRSFLIGFLILLGSIPLAVFLGVTIIGIPLALLVGAVVMAGICLGTVAVCDWIGLEISRRMGRPLAPVWSGLLGLAVLFLVGLIPWIGAVVHVIAVLLGLGAVYRTRFKPAAPDERTGG